MRELGKSWGAWEPGLAAAWRGRTGVTGWLINLKRYDTGFDRRRGVKMGGLNESGWGTFLVEP